MFNFNPQAGKNKRKSEFREFFKQVRERMKETKAIVAFLVPNLLLGSAKFAPSFAWKHL
jgi:hypothetical protein